MFLMGMVVFVPVGGILSPAQKERIADINRKGGVAFVAHSGAEALEALGADGLYPCAEGAGYAGGIMSAAVDGLRCAEKVLKKYREG